MKTIMIISVIALTSCTQVILGPDKAVKHGSVHISTHEHHHDQKPGSPIDLPR